MQFARSSRFLGLAAAVALSTATGAAAALSDLSADAQKIVAQVEKENADIQPVCSDETKLKAAVTQATEELYKAGSLSGGIEAAHEDGEAAGKYLYENCPPKS